MKALKSLRLHIGLFGRTNIGKSSFLNKITNQAISIVSDTAGTTTDVVEKSMELFPIGPVNFLDTAGLDDTTILGKKRIEKTLASINRCDVAVLVLDFNGISNIEKDYNSSAIIMGLIQSETTPHNHNSFIISNDVYSYQIPALIPSTFLLRPSTNTKLVTSNTVIDSMYPRKGSIVTSDLSSALLPVIMAYHKCPELGMQMINNFKTTINIIRDKIANNKILNNYNSPIMFKNESEEILNRLYLSDLMSITRTYVNSYEALINSWKVYKPYDISVLANALDNLFNKDEENILNYIFLLEIDKQFVVQMS